MMFRPKTIEYGFILALLILVFSIVMVSLGLGFWLGATSSLRPPLPPPEILHLEESAPTKPEKWDDWSE